MKIIFIHGIYGKTTLALLLKRYHAGKADVIHLDDYVKHVARDLVGSKLGGALEGKYQHKNVVFHLGEFYRDYKTHVLQQLQPKIPEIITTKPGCKILIIDGIYKQYMKNILNYFKKINQPVSACWVEVQYHTHVKIDSNPTNCNFEIPHNNNRDAVELETYLNTLDVVKYFNDLVSCDVQVSQLLSP